MERGIARAKAGHYSQALECYKQALERCPDNVDALVAAGAARANQEDLLGALQCFDDALGAALQGLFIIPLLAIVPLHRRHSALCTSCVCERSEANDLVCFQMLPD